MSTSALHGMGRTMCREPVVVDEPTRILLGIQFAPFDYVHIRMQRAPTLRQPEYLISLVARRQKDTPPYGRQEGKMGRRRQSRLVMQELTEVFPAFGPCPDRTRSEPTSQRTIENELHQARRRGRIIAIPTTKSKQAATP